MNTKSLLTIPAILIGACLSCTAQTPLHEKKSPDFTPLFNGKDLTGWIKRGGSAEYKVEDGCIVGTTTAGSPNTFLSTEKDYYNFELHFAVKIDHDALNSGCQIRSHHQVKANHPNGYVYGYQVEIATNGTAGFIYDEGGRGWLSKERNDPNKNKAFKKGAWNQYRIVCKDHSIKTWVNGVLIAEIEDDHSIGGLIGLQVHSVPGDPKWSVRWKDVKIRELPDTDHKLTALFTDAKLSHFETDGGWFLNEKTGVLGFKPKPEEYVGRHPWTVYNNYLWLKKQYSNFVCEFEYKFEPGGNSGFYFLVQDKKNPPPTGPELQLEESASKKGENTTFHDCAGLMMGAPIRRADKNVFKGPNTWNRMLVFQKDKKLKVWHNGRKVHDIDLKDVPHVKNHPARGFIGLQDHGLPVFYRNFAIKSLE